MSVNAIAGFLALGFLDTNGEFEELLAYPRTPIGLNHQDLGHVPEVVPGPGAGPSGQVITTGAIYTEEEDGILLLTYQMVPPYAVVPQPLPTLSPRLHLLFGLELAVNATGLGAATCEVTIEPGEPIGSIDGQLVVAHVRLTVVDGALCIGGLTREERSAEQVRKLAATRARKATARAAFLERDRLMAPRRTITIG